MFPLIRPGPSRWIALGAFVLLLAGIVLAMRQWRIPLDSPEPAPVVADDDSTVIERALAQIPAGIDSTELKNRWVDEVKGVDVGALDPGQRELYVRFANAQRCTCGCGFTLAACRTYDPTCPVSLPRVEALRDSVRFGWACDTTGLRARPRLTPLASGG